jgi:light-regulated signal transduction histidine kinase (bacteriophytochrome)
VLPQINGFESELKILFQQLILNAIKFKKKECSPEITLAAEKLPEEWVFTVSDNGMGILKKDHEKVFGIFKQMHNHDEYEGIGMGLAYCKKIVELHGGRLWIDSTPGKGSTFKFTIPFSK